jgi:molybdopterin/thiamine biosynthesis adenylyltransferase
VTSASGDPGLASWEDHVAYLRESFINHLVGRGLRLRADHSRGATSDATLRNDRITVTIGDGFPYLPPTVRTNAEIPRTWHQEPNGNLCLFTARDRDSQPWLDVDAFLRRIDQWFVNTEAGWPDDHPALDIEAYLDLPLDPRYVLYADLNRLSDDYVLVTAQSHLLKVKGSGKVPKKSRSGLLSGYVTDLGVLARPPLNWADLITNIAEPERVSGAIKRRRLDVLLIQYTRQTQRGVLAITFKDVKQGERSPHFAFSGSADPTVMQLRAGPTAPMLATKHVYVVGAGALGSLICDGLSRAGLGKLTIRDCDFLSPGNMTRHLVTNIELSGTAKAQAVAAVLQNRPYNRTVVRANNSALTSPTEAARLFGEYDLVVEATADGAVTSMLEDAVAIAGGRFVTACIQNEGRTLRVDIVPPYNDAHPFPPTVQQPATQPEVFEAGCGEPISATPPHSVAEAAAMTVRHIIGILMGAPETPAGEVRDIP